MAGIKSQDNAQHALSCRLTSTIAPIDILARDVKSKKCVLGVCYRLGGSQSCCTNLALYTALRFLYPPVRVAHAG
jgi:hypothetical protein